MSDLTRAEIELVAYNFPGADEAITQLLRQLDSDNSKLALHESENVTRGLLIDKLEAQLINAEAQANARVGAALREAATEGAGLVDGNVEAASVYGAILALAPDATAALDRALEQMRKRCAQEAQYIATVGDGQSIAAAIRALPLHEGPKT